MTSGMLTDIEVCLKCVDINEVIYDEKGRHLQRVSTSPLDCKEELFREILTNLQTCQDVCFNFLKQLVIIKEPRVRFKPQNDVSCLQMRIEDTGLSPDTKTCLRDISKACYNLVKEAGLLSNLIEFDSERHATVDMFGKKLEKVVGFMDMVSLLNTKNINKDRTDKHTGTQKEGLENQVKQKDGKTKEKTSKASEAIVTNKCDEAVKDNLKETQTVSTRKCQPNEKKLSKLKRQSKVQDSKYNLNASVSKTDITESKDSSKTFQTITEVKEEQNVYEKAVVTFVLTPRISVNAVQVFRQLLYLHMLPGSHLYLLVCHIGPLNEDQEIVLYKFIPNEMLINASTENHCLNLTQLEDVFRNINGQRLQQLADLKEYFKYYIYDCPGVKDHAKDNRKRLERYLQKKELKKEIKKKEREKEEESEYGSEIAEPCSLLSKSESSVSEISDCEIMSAADLQSYMQEIKGT